MKAKRLFGKQDRLPGKRSRILSAKTARGRRSEVYSDLSQVEEQKDRRFFRIIGKLASENALNENKALGIAVTFWDNGRVMQRMPDGKIITLKTRAGLSNEQPHPARRFPKGTVLHVAK